MTALRRTGSGLCLCGAALGALGLAGWLFDASIVTTIVAGRPAMMPNTAFSLLILGLAAAASHHASSEDRIRTVVASVLALVVLAVGVATLVEYAVGWNLGIDQWLVPVATTSVYPGRPSPPTAVALTLLATALLIPTRWAVRGVRPAEWMTLAGAFLAFVTLVGHAYGAGPIYQMRSVPTIGVALPTAVALVLIAAGMLLRSPAEGAIGLAMSRGPSGLLVRRLGIVAICGPPLLGAVSYRALQLAGVVDVPLGMAIVTALAVPVALALIFVTAVKLERAHGALETGRELARTLIEESADGVFVADLDGRYTDVNAAGCHMLGRARDEIVGFTIMDLLHPDEIERLQEARTSLLQGGTQTAEWRLRKKDGAYLSTEVSAKIFADGRWQGIVRDITRRKEAEEAARRSEARLERAAERFRFLAEAGEILGASLDTEDSLTKLAALAVRSFATTCIIELSNEDGGLIRIRADASQGSAPALVHVDRRAPNPGEPRGRLSAPREPLLVAGVDGVQALGLDERTVAVFREMRAASLMDVPIVAGARVIGAMLLLAGASGSQYGPADLQAAQDLARRTGLAAENGRLYRAAQAATRAKDEMLSIVAHDLRAPLAAAQAAAGLLVHQIPEDRREACRKSAETIHRSIRLATRLVEDLLDVARIDAGRLSLDLKKVSPEVLVHNALESCQAAAVGAGVDIEAEVAPGLHLVLADEDRVQQALGNLLHNAIKFTPTGGLVRLVAQRDGEAIRFAVIDKGSGIAADQLPRVFDRFWQGPGADRRGAGLGLAIANGIVDAHGGRIRAESAPGQGSVFSFTLPVCRVEAS